MKLHLCVAFLFLFSLALTTPLLSQEESTPWKQDIPLPQNHRITLWLDHGWLKAARLNEKNQLLWAIVLKRWNPKEGLRAEQEGAGMNIYDAKGKLILRNSLYDYFSPMVLRSTHETEVPDTNALIDPDMFGLHHFVPSGGTDDILVRQTDTSEWIYAGAGPVGTNRFEFLVRLMPLKLGKDKSKIEVGSDGVRLRTGDYEMYDEAGFFFVEQMADSLAKRELVIPESLLDKKAPPLSVYYWFNTDSPISLDSLRGSVVMLYFWGVWCRPCVAHLDDITSLAHRIDSSTFHVVTIHTKSSWSKLGEFLKDNNFPFPVGVDSGQTMQVYTNNTVPRYVLIDKNGFIRSVADKLPSDVFIKQLLTQ
ncbi:MAG: TlpA family protein disulfide reductase [Bacteroidota bacterium]|nr:TlpA family protein disulfide reductase [Bacteroidota bacterium]